MTDANFDNLPFRAINIANEWGVYDRKTGLAGVWGSMLRQWLEDAIPKSVKGADLDNLHIALTPTFRPPKVTSEILGRSDLIDAIMASCHVPVFLDGRPFTEYKGESVIDGSFWYFMTKDRYTGLPFPENVSPSNVFWVDYVDDEDFMQSISGNFLELITPDDLFDMVEHGYNFMKREHNNGRLPFPKYSRPGYSSYGSDVASSISLLPRRIGKSLVSSLRYSAMPSFLSAVKFRV